MKTSVYLIRTLTNLHAGSGDANFGIVDKEIQYDPTTSYPTIHSSGIKGALREFFTQKHKDFVTDIFGGDGASSSKGKLAFLGADLLALPYPDENQPFALKYSEGALKMIEGKCLLFAKDKFADKLKAALPAAPILEPDFKELIEELPVIARNYIENGKSANLWYERVVPRETLFVTMVQELTDGNYLTAFDEILKDNPVIQLGANATVGYGYCEFKKL